VLKKATLPLERAELSSQTSSLRYPSVQVSVAAVICWRAAAIAGVLLSLLFVCDAQVHAADLPVCRW